MTDVVEVAETAAPDPPKPSLLDFFMKHLLRQIAYVNPTNPFKDPCAPSLAINKKYPVRHQGKRELARRAKQARGRDLGPLEWPNATGDLP